MVISLIELDCYFVQFKFPSNSGTMDIMYYLVLFGITIFKPIGSILQSKNTFTLWI